MRSPTIIYSNTSNITQSTEDFQCCLESFALRTAYNRDFNEMNDCCRYNGLKYVFLRREKALVQLLGEGAH